MEDDWSSEELDDGSHGGKKPVNRRPAGSVLAENTSTQRSERTAVCARDEPFADPALRPAPSAGTGPSLMTGREASWTPRAGGRPRLK